MEGSQEAIPLLGRIKNPTTRRAVDDDNGVVCCERIRADRNSGRATASRNTPISSTAAIVPMPPSVMTARANPSPNRTQERVVRGRDRPVNVAFDCMPGGSV